MKFTTQTIDRAIAAWVGAPSVATTRERQIALLSCLLGGWAAWRRKPNRHSRSRLICGGVSDATADLIDDPQVIEAMIEAVEGRLEELRDGATPTTSAGAEIRLHFLG